jgi:hypothetical protein
MDMAETVREAVAREVEPLLLRCAAIDAEISRDEAALPIVLGEYSERDAIRLRREKLARVVSELQTDRLVQTILRHIEDGG